MSRSVMTIAHVLHRLCPAGAEILAADLARQLKGNYRFVFFCLDEIGPLGHQLEAEGFDVVDLARSPGVDFKLAKRLRLATRQHEVKLLHAHQYTPFFYAAMSRRLSPAPPVLFTEHGRHYPDHRRIKRLIANRFLVRRIDRMTAVGRFVKQALIEYEGLAADRIQVIHNGIEPSPFSDQDPRAAFCDEVGLDPGKPICLHVARFHPVKDHGTAIHAFARVVAQIPQAALVLAGDGENRGKMESLAQDLKVAENLRFLGVRADIPRLMAAVDLLLLSSLSEGLSVTLLEAMAASLPIAATDVGGNSEVVIHGQTGLLSLRGDAAALAMNMLTLIKDPKLRASMGEKGRKRLDQYFTQQQMHTAYNDLYQQMLKKSH